MRTTMPVLMLVGMMGVLGTQGCLDAACASNLPLIQAAIIYGDDAEAALNQAQGVFDALPMPDEARRDVAGAMDKAWQALRAGQKALVAANSACTQVDPLIIFSDFITAWKAVAVLLGKHSASLKAGSSDALTPEIVKMADAHR